MHFGFWNIRGMFNPVKKAEVRRLITFNNLSLIGFIETKVPENLFVSISSLLFKNWKWVANYDFSSRGRIWVSWDPKFISFEILSINDQAVHGRIKFNHSGLMCYVYVIYGEHTYIQRRPLWEDLLHVNALLQDSA